MICKLHTTQSLIQLTISGYVLIFGLAQLIIVPISDQTGRKKVMLIGSLIYLLGMILCIFSLNITILIMTRTITAIGAACMSVVAYAIIQDVYSEKELPKIYSYFNCILAIPPILAPIVGGALEELWGWQSIFVFLTLLEIWSLLL